MMFSFVVQNEFLEWRRMNTKKERPFLSNNSKKKVIWCYFLFRYIEIPLLCETTCTCDFLLFPLRPSLKRKRKRWKQRENDEKKNDNDDDDGGNAVFQVSWTRIWMKHTQTRKKARIQRIFANFAYWKLLKNVDASEWSITKRIQGHAYICHFGCVADVDVDRDDVVS